MALSADSAKRVAEAVASKAAGNEVVDALNAASAVAGQNLYAMPALIVATNVSSTIDFGSLAIGDKIVMIPAVSGNSTFMVCATAGTLPVSAVVGNAYLIFRNYVAPAASAITF